LLNRSSILCRYGTALIAVGVALGLKLLIVPMSTQEVPFLLFLGAVVVAAWNGGFGPGLMATALATILSDYFFMTPFYRFEVADYVGWVKLSLFAIEGAFVSGLGSRMLSAKNRAEASAARAQQLERRIIEIGDQEQQRIGRDLHDGVGQLLTGIALLSRHLSGRLTALNIPEAADASKITDLVNDAVRQARDLATGLSPYIVQTEGLAGGLRELVTHTRELCNVECELEADSGVTIENDMLSGHLYRIAQEAIHNAVKHSGAGRITVRLQKRRNGLELMIRDDGTGLPKELHPGAGMGLQTMHERARLIGGTLEVRSEPSGGTTVLCTVPSTALSSKQV
jgi:signal transduction histidine kinase